MTHTLRNCRIDGILAHVTLHSEVIRVGAFIFLQGSALNFVLVRRIPCSQDDFATTSHGLRIRRHHGDSTKIV
jgi:hypothetical protein